MENLITNFLESLQGSNAFTIWAVVIVAGCFAAAINYVIYKALNILAAGLYRAVESIKAKLNS
jgi:hypothetical protein